MDRLAPFDLVRPRRAIEGWSAVLLPFDDAGAIDWPSLRLLLERTVEAGLVPALNMDTGFANLLGAEERRAVLQLARAVLGGTAFAAGAYVGDRPGDAFDAARYHEAIEEITAVGGIPVVFQSHGLTSLGATQLVEAYRAMGQWCDRFVAFELGSMFAPFGTIYPLEVWAELLTIEACIGAKHSSLHRVPEWERLRLRDERRPEFHVFTGNDLAIDMVMYGSDYLLGLSAFAPDAFARRDRAWAEGDPAFYELNDVLQALGSFAFRSPVPAYKHTAAQFLMLRGWLRTDAVHPAAPRRPVSDLEVLSALRDRLEQTLETMR